MDRKQVNEILNPYNFPKKHIFLKNHNAREFFFFFSFFFSIIVFGENLIKNIDGRRH